MTSELIEKIIDWLTEYKEKTDCKGVVLGVSGGKDSTVVAMLAKKVWGDKVFGVLMPNKVQADIGDALDVVNGLNMEHTVVNIGDAVKAINEAIPMDVSGKAMTNIPPRVRMTVLYSIAQTLGYRVIGTGNRSEAFIGWTTKWGDSAYDLNPIYHLTCGEVIEIGKALAMDLGLRETLICKAPADGLTGKSDEDNFGFTYAELDAAVKGECEISEKISELHKASEHKRVMPYTMLS